jgi:bifunctional DNase/RNase
MTKDRLGRSLALPATAASIRENVLGRDRERNREASVNPACLTIKSDRHRTARPFRTPLTPQRAKSYCRTQAADVDPRECRLMAVQMELHKIIISELQEQQIIMLKEVDGERTFPIVIGNGEALAIDRRLKGVPTPRPLTHDLLASVIEHLGGSIEQIEINDLENHTFFARIHIRQDGKVLEIDSRPSDAIALGIATSVPIYVAEHVLDEVC